MNALLGCVVGQFLSIIVALYNFGAANIDAGYFKFNVLSVYYIGLIIFSQTYISIGLKRNRPLKPIIVLICGTCDFIGNISLLYANAFPINNYLVIFLSQLTFIMLIFVKKFIIFSKDNVNVKIIFEFLGIIVGSFFINWLSGGIFKFNFVGAAFAILSNFCFITKTLLSEKVSEDDHVFYIRDYSIMAFISGFILSILFDYKNLENPISFIREYTIPAIIYIVGMIFSYILGIFFMKIWGSDTYEASILSYSTYYGIITLISENRVQAFYITGYMICIFATLIVVLSSLKKLR